MLTLDIASQTMKRKRDKNALLMCLCFFCICISVCIWFRRCLSVLVNPISHMPVGHAPNLTIPRAMQHHSSFIRANGRGPGRNGHCLRRRILPNITGAIIIAHRLRSLYEGQLNENYDSACQNEI